MRLTKTRRYVDQRAANLQSNIAALGDEIDDLQTTHTTLQQNIVTFGGEINTITMTVLNSMPPSEFFKFVSHKAHLPAADVNNIITLVDECTYFFTTTVDLEGARLVCGRNQVLLGGSSENSRIKSTGLLGAALVTSDYSLAIRYLTLEAHLVLDLDGSRGDHEQSSAIDWDGVNFTNCGAIGRIKDYTNVIYINSAFLNSGNMVLDGTIGTIGISGCLLVSAAAQSAIVIASTALVTRRFRIIYSSIVALDVQASQGITIENAASIVNDESFILDTVNFSGGGVYVAGEIAPNSNKALFVKCIGVTNTAVSGQMFMQGNNTPTIINNTDTFVKVEGTTTASADNTKYSHSDNRLINNASVQRKYLINATLSFISGNNNQCQFGIYDSRLSALCTPSITRATANSSGRAESIHLACIIRHTTGDYIEVFCRNTTGATNITVFDMNVIIVEIA
jgi:hypothetical protein